MAKLHHTGTESGEDGEFDWFALEADLSKGRLFLVPTELQGDDLAARLAVEVAEIVTDDHITCFSALDGSLLQRCSLKQGEIPRDRTPHFRAPAVVAFMVRSGATTWYKESPKVVDQGRKVRLLQGLRTQKPTMLAMRDRKYGHVITRAAETVLPRCHEIDPGAPEPEIQAA